MKKIVSSVLCTALLAAPVLSSFPHTTSAETLAQQNDNQSKNSNHQIEEDIVVDGKTIATKISSVNSQKEVLQDRTVVTLQFDTQYQFKESATELDKEIFQNETSTMEIEQTNDGTYYMDGEALTQADLDMDLSSYASGSSLNGGPAMQIAAGDYGGVASFSHYRSSDFNFYALNTYSAISKTLKPSGSHISKSGAIGNPKVARAMTLMNSFQTNFNNMHTSIQGVLTGAASFGLTLGTVIGAVISGTVVSGTAIAALNYWKACNSDLQRTYDLLVTM